ncbi:TPA: type II secretion system pilot lipoprotein GspS-beta [Escherichia coli]
MSTKQITGKIVIPALMSIAVFLSGCAGYTSEAALLAKKQAQNISMNLPVQSEGYTLISAQNSGTLIKMNIISDSKGQYTPEPDTFLDRFQLQICTDPTVKTMMSEGIHYAITINEIRSGNQYQRKLDRTVCEMAKI